MFAILPILAACVDETTQYLMDSEPLDLPLYELDKTASSLAKYCQNEKPVDEALLVNFWNAGCEPCVEELPLLTEINATMVPVLGCHLNSGETLDEYWEQMSSITDALTELDQDSFPQRITLFTDYDDFTARYGLSTIGAIPYSVLLDSQCRLVSEYAGPIETYLASLDTTIDEL